MNQKRRIKNKKRVVLINFYDKISLSLKALSAKLKEAGHEAHIIYLKDDRAEIIDKFKEDSLQYQVLWLDQLWGSGQDISTTTPLEWDLFYSLIKKIKPDVIGISSRSPHRELAKYTAKKLRAVAPEAIFLAGGYGPILETKEYLEEFDYVCIGEGDNVIVPFVEAQNKKSVPNICYLKDGKIIANELLPPVNLDDLPFPDWSADNKYFIENEEIKTGYSFYDSQTYDIFCSRGCPSSCSYCMICQWNSILKPFGSNFPKFRLRSPRSVIKELKEAKKNYNIKYVRIKDDIFGVSEKWLFEFLDMYDKEIGLEFSCLVDERFIDEKRLKRLYKSGLRKTTVGIQSADEDIRRRIMNRQISDDEIIDYANMVRLLGIQIKYDLIGWNPFENHKTLKKGMYFLKKLPKYADVCVFELKLFPKSPIHEMYLRKKPKRLSADEYTYWALIHQMVLFSKETEEKAFALVDNLKKNTSEVLSIFRETVKKKTIRQRLFATTDIEKGCRIMNDRIGLTESNESGISSDEFTKLIGMKAKIFIKKGTILKWDYFYHSYADIRGRDIGNK